MTINRTRLDDEIDKLIAAARYQGQMEWRELYHETYRHDWIFPFLAGAVIATIGYGIAILITHHT